MKEETQRFGNQKKELEMEVEKLRETVSLSQG